MAATGPGRGDGSVRQPLGRPGLRWRSFEGRVVALRAPAEAPEGHYPVAAAGVGVAAVGAGTRSDSSITQVSPSHIGAGIVATSWPSSDPAVTPPAAQPDCLVPSSTSWVSPDSTRPTA